MSRMTKGPGLPGSPFSTASFAPAGKVGGAAPHLISLALTSVAPALAPSPAETAAAPADNKQTRIACTTFELIAFSPCDTLRHRVAPRQETSNDRDAEFICRDTGRATHGRARSADGDAQGSAAQRRGVSECPPARALRR